jgi:hypothetical protein
MIQDAEDVLKQKRTTTPRKKWGYRKLHEDLGMNEFQNCLVPNKNCVGYIFAKKTWELWLTTKSFSRKL